MSVIWQGRHGGGGLVELRQDGDWTHIVCDPDKIHAYIIPLNPRYAAEMGQALVAASSDHQATPDEPGRRVSE